MDLESPEIIGRQATINIGTIGHVAHGKSTVVKAISGVQPIRFSDEMERNITIRLGYGNAKIFKCPMCPRPNCYSALGSGAEASPPCETCGTPMKLLRHVSFVDCPGHDVLMATMLNGVAVMDAALLLIAANEPCPQPQTAEHLAAVEIMKMKNLIILQNKIDLVSRRGAEKQMKDIRTFVKGSIAESSPVIPLSAQLRINIDVLCEYIVTKIPIPVRDVVSPARMVVIRTFDVNRPGQEVKDLRGGVLGGTLSRGVLQIGQEVEIRPGIILSHEDGTMSYTPLRSRILTLFAEQTPLERAVPGGLIAVGTKIDPMLTRANRLVGHVLGPTGSLPDVYMEIGIHVFLLKTLLGVKECSGRIAHLTRGESLMLNIGSMSTGGKVEAIEDKKARISLALPVCTGIGERVALSRRVETHWRLIGWGRIVEGVEATKID